MTEQQNTRTVRVRVVHRDGTDGGRLVREFHTRPPMTIAEQVEREQQDQEGRTA
ncbi:hypothetical protein [Streptomyces sediminimaris]|uniref:hypothetical protein n=1 Tax=Streptomyces sediminimaris TaxID=3383721 RepID=UPI003999BCEC